MRHVKFKADNKKSIGANMGIKMSYPIHTYNSSEVKSYTKKELQKLKLNQIVSILNGQSNALKNQQSIIRHYKYKEKNNNFRIDKIIREIEFLK